VSELEDQFEEMVRALSCDTEHQVDHLKKASAQAMAEFDNAGPAATSPERSGVRFARRHVIRRALAASLLTSAGLGVAVYLAPSRQTEPENLETVSRMELDRLQTQLVTSLRTVDGMRSDQNPAAHDRAVDACLTWHLSRAADIP
jgi:hypothetical protein